MVGRETKRGVHIYFPFSGACVNGESGDGKTKKKGF